MNTSLFVTISLFCWLFFVLSFNYDRRRYRNCALLFIALVSTVPAFCSLAGPNALIREFVAIHSEKKHFYMLVGGWVLSVIIPMIYAMTV